MSTPLPCRVDEKQVKTVMRSDFSRSFRVMVFGWLSVLQLAGANYRVFVTNERSGDLTIIDSVEHKAIATVPIGKRPRGIHASKDGKLLFIALSGTPISGPPALDAQGNPIFKKHADDDDEDERKSDKSADGIAVFDARELKVLRKINGGSDPEQFALSPDGTRLYTSNEDVGSASIVNIQSGKIEQIVPVSKEPEGVEVRPDGKVFYVTCETEGEVFAIDTARYKVVKHFNVGGRPRSVAFLPDSSKAFIPSESAGLIHLVDAMNHKPLKKIVLPPGSRPMCVKVSPDGKKLYASTGRGGTILAIDIEKFELLGAIKVGARPWGICFSPDGELLYVANGPSNDVSIINVAQAKEIGRIKAGESPWGIAVAVIP
jgi:YVTN family beta-propeller protein